MIRRAGTMGSKVQAGAPVGWSLIGSGSLTAADRTTFGAIPATYDRLLLTVSGGSGSATANWNFEMSEDAGATWPHSVPITTASGAAVVFALAISIENYRSLSTSLPKVAIVNRAISGSFLAGYTGIFSSALPVNMMSVLLSAGTFDAGTWNLMGQ